MLASAYDIAVENDDGVIIYYNLIPKGNMAEVTYMNSSYNSYSGPVTIPDKFTYDGVEYTVTSIGDKAFYRCTSLISVTIPNSVTTLGICAFQGCIGLTSVTIPNSVATIGDAAFYQCTGLTSVTIGNSVTTIGNNAFQYCTGLTSVTIPSSVITIGDYAFDECSGLTSVTIPNSVTTIGNSAFYGCGSLTSVTIPNSVTYIGNYAFGECTGLTSVTIGNSVTIIGWNAFSHCIGLTSVTIPNSVITIRNSAFYECTGLTSVTIGNSVTNIQSQVFAECRKLEDVYCHAENVPLTSTDAFDKSYPEYTTLYVPAESLNDYNTTEPWSMFGTIKAISGTGEETTKCTTPTISYANKELTFSCETEGVEFVSRITDVDIKNFYSKRISLSATYEISVYATKAGYNNSDVATAILVWTNSEFTETTPSGSSVNAPTESVPVLISSHDGFLTVKSELEGQSVSVYSLDGKALGSAQVKGGQAVIATNLPKGTIVVVKVGERSVKALL